MSVDSLGFESEVERAIMYALRECINGPVKRSVVTTAMRNQSRDARHEAARRIMAKGYAKSEMSVNQGRGRTAVLLEATGYGESEYRRLCEKYMDKHTTIWR